MPLLSLFVSIVCVVALTNPVLAQTGLASKTPDSYQQIRNASGRINYAGKTFLIDPMLAERGRYPGFSGSFNSEKRNPLIDLPMEQKKVCKNIDAVIVTHTHLDHWDEVAQQIVPQGLPIFVQHEDDADLLKSQGFVDVRVLEMERTIEFKGILLNKTGGAHGTVEMFANPDFAREAGDAMGVVFRAEGHKTVYLVGDTVWTADVSKALHRYQPEVLVMNTGDARFKFAPNDQIIMSKGDVERAVKAIPNARIIAVHMDAVNHTLISREEMRKFLKEKGIEKNVAVPNDGDIVEF